MSLCLENGIISKNAKGGNYGLYSNLATVAERLCFCFTTALLYFFLLNKRKKTQFWSHIVTALIFLYYLIGVFTMTGIGKLKAFSPKLVLIPFRDMISGPVDTALNVLLFMPLGIFLPIMYKSFNKLSKVALLGFMLSLTIELIQMFGHGTTDINDLITNTVGACLGFGIYKIADKAVNRRFDKFKANKINDLTEIALFAAISLIIMITVQPIVIHELFGLG